MYTLILNLNHSDGAFALRYLSHGGSGISDNKLNIEYDTYHMDDKELEITNIYTV